MFGSSRKNGLCLKSLEQELERSSETYRHIDLICFGFPCQDISSANPEGKGIKGERSSIFFECMRIVNILNPTWLLIENVPRLLSINNGRDMATVLQTISQSGYGWAYRILDSQYFGVPQQRRRIFIVGYFGGFCPPEILFEQKSSRRNDKKKQKMGERGLCITTKNGQRQDPTTETIIASTIRKTAEFNSAMGGGGGNFIASTIGTTQNPDPNYGTHFVAQTIGATPRGNTSFVWQDTYIAEINSQRKREITRIPKGLDSRRGIIIGNTVTVQVAEWIGKRIIKYGK